jgi:hypothetical protein
MIINKKVFIFDCFLYICIGWNEFYKKKEFLNYLGFPKFFRFKKNG